MSNLGLCRRSVVLMSFKSKRDFLNTEIYGNPKCHGVWAELEMKIYFLRQSWTKYCRQIHKN